MPIEIFSQIENYSFLKIIHFKFGGSLLDTFQSGKLSSSEVSMLKMCS